MGVFAFFKKNYSRVVSILMVSFFLLLASNIIMYIYTSRFRFNSKSTVIQYIPEVIYIEEITISNKSRSFLGNLAVVSYRLDVNINGMEDSNKIAENKGMVRKNKDNINILPYPFEYRETEKGLKIQFSDIKFSIYDKGNDVFSTSWIVNYTISTYYHLMLEDYPPIERNEGDNKKLNVYVEVDDLKTNDNSYNKVEEYEMYIDKKGVFITCRNINSLSYALETLTQIIKQRSISNLPLYVKDKPRFKWRGLRIDATKHFITVSKLKETIDGMSYNKLNVLQLKISSDIAFVVDVPEVPLLRMLSTLHKEAFFSVNEMKSLVEYANLRGVRIVPEIDFPFNLGSINKVDADFCIKCGGKYHFNPINQKALDMLRSILISTMEVFSDEYVLIGGSSFDSTCLQNNIHVKKYLNDFKKSISDLEKMAYEIIFDTLQTKKLIVYDTAEKALLSVGLESDKYVLTGACKGVKKSCIRSDIWNFHKVDPFTNRCNKHYGWLDNWIDHYKQDPTDGTGQSAQHIIGAVAYVDTEQVNSFSLSQVIWPRGCGLGERLWSKPGVNFVDRNNYHGNGMRKSRNFYVIQFRMATHTCENMLRRNIPAGSVRTDGCFFDPVKHSYY